MQSHDSTEREQQGHISSLRHDGYKFCILSFRINIQQTLSNRVKGLKLEDVVVAVSEFGQGSLDLSLLHAILGSTYGGVLAGTGVHGTNQHSNQSAGHILVHIN